jgi:hypothetical protein
MSAYVPVTLPTGKPYGGWAFLWDKRIKQGDKTIFPLAASLKLSI